MLSKNSECEWLGNELVGLATKIKRMVVVEMKWKI